MTTDRVATCVVCGRVKGPGKMTFTPEKDNPSNLVPIHGNHRITTIFRAGIELTLVPK